MATWGKLKINTNKYETDSTLYYDYSTTSDIFFFKGTWVDNESYGDGKIHEWKEYLSDEQGEAMMEAFINHYMAMNCSGDVERFVDRYIKNNRFVWEGRKA